MPSVVEDFEDESIQNHHVATYAFGDSIWKIEGKSMRKKILHENSVENLMKFSFFGVSRQVSSI